MSELDPPEGIDGDPKARELARIWAMHGKQVVVFDPNLWDDPAGWGIFLVDFMKHVANAYLDVRGDDKAETLKRIREGFDAEWVNPTDKV